MSQSAPDFLGCGWRFPVGVDDGGQIARATGEDWGSPDISEGCLSGTSR
jgi:hypothetical protein